MVLKLNAYLPIERIFFQKYRPAVRKMILRTAGLLFKTKGTAKAVPFIYVCHNFFKLKLFLLPD